MIIGITRELVAGENRVSLCPDNAKSLVDKGVELWLEKDAGAQAGFSDDDYISIGEFQLIFLLVLLNECLFDCGDISVFYHNDNISPLVLDS